MTDRPNILLITADQWRGDSLGFLGHPDVRTPHLDAFAQEAVTFTNHLAPCAPCSPARASLYTGLYQMNHRVVANGTPLDARFDNIALAARRAGYRPSLFGYTDTALDPRDRDPNDPALQSYEEVLPGFECRQALREDDRTWITWLEGRGHGPDLLRDPHRVAPAPGGGVSLSPPGYGADETQTAFLVESFRDWHDEQSDAPWFAHISFLRPHPPFVVPDPYASLIDPADVAQPIPPSETPHLLPRLTRELTPAAAFQPGLTGSVADLTAEDFRRLRVIYAGMIAEVDAQLGRLFETLRERSDWEDTLVIFTSDHGEMMGDHGLLGKGGFYREGQHIPLMIRFPGLGARRVDGFTSAVDIFPTLAEIWGIAPRHAPDGLSLLPLAAGKPQKRNNALWEFDFRHLLPPGLSLPPRDCHLTVLRTATVQYVHSPAFPPLLFDLSDDPSCQAPIEDPDSSLRVMMAEALLSEVTRLRDDTLAGLPLQI